MNPFKLAKKILKLRGWCKGSRHNDDGKSCLIGAFENNAGKSVYDFFGDNAPEGPILKAIILDRFLDRLGYDSFNGVEVGPENGAIEVVACFNNHPETKLEDVLSVLDEAAKQ